MERTKGETMISIIQIVMIIFALFAWSRAFVRLRDKDVGLGEFAFWSIIWVAVIVFALDPGILGGVSSIVGIGRAVDLAVYVSIIVLFYLLFRMYVRMDKQNQELTTLVREIAIKNRKKKK